MGWKESPQGDVDDMDIPEELVIDEEDRDQLVRMTELEREDELTGRKEKQRRDQDIQRMLETVEETTEFRGKNISGVGRSAEGAHLDDASDEEQDVASQTGTPPAAREQSRGAGDLLSEKDSEDFDADNKEAVENEAEFNDYLAAQIFRSDLERWISEPHFEKSVLGCFVRFHGGGSTNQEANRNEYIMVEVIGCEPKEDSAPYNFGPGNKPTKMQLLLRRGGSEFWTAVNVISNSPFTPKEFQEWVQACKKHGRQLLSRTELDEKKEQITQARNFVFTHTEVKKILDAKRKKGSLKMSNVMQRANLMRLRTFYDNQNDAEKVIECDEKIKGLEAKADAQRRFLSTSAAERLASARQNQVKVESVESWIEHRRPRLLEKFEKKLQRLPPKRRPKALLEFFGPKHPRCAGIRDSDIHLPFLEKTPSPELNPPLPEGLISDPDLHRDVLYSPIGDRIARGLKRLADAQSELDTDSIICSKLLKRWPEAARRPEHDNDAAESDS